MILNKDLFILPHNNNFILYLPKAGNILEVNHSTVYLLKQIGKNIANISSIDKYLIQKLVEAKVVIDKEFTPRIKNEKIEICEFNPEGLSLFLTSECTMNCIYCYANGGENNSTLPWNIAKSAIDFVLDKAVAKKRKDIFLHFHGGGEVTTKLKLMKRCTDYFRDKCGDMKPRIGAGLNGFMSSKTLDWVTNNLDDITISFDGIEKIQNSHRPLLSGKGSFSKVVQSIKKLDKRRVKYGLRMTVTEQSLPYLADSVKFMCEHFKTDIIQAEPFFKVGRAELNNLNSVDPVSFVQEFRKARQIANEAGVKLTYSGARFGVITDIFCKACSNSMGVTTDGHLSSCYEITDISDRRSNIFYFGKYNSNTDSFDIDYQKLKRLKNLSVTNKALCNKCFCKWHCAGDCPAKQATFGDPWDPVYNERCYITQELTKDQIIESLEKL